MKLAQIQHNVVQWYGWKSKLETKVSYLVSMEERQDNFITQTLKGIWDDTFLNAIARVTLLKFIPPPRNKRTIDLH